MSEEMEVGTEVPKNGNEEAAPEENVNNAEYIKQLMREKLSLEPESHGITMRLLDKELAKAQKGKNYAAKPVHDVLRDRPIRASVKISLPTKEYPRFNFVGKLLGPRGSTLKKLQEETMTKMAILGRGSMRDKTKEDECKESLDPKYSHLSDDLHIEIFANGPPAEAYARLAFALVELRKHLTPDDESAPPSGLGGPDLGPRARPGPGPGPGPRPGPGGPPFRGGPQRGGASKVMSILDRARMSMDGGYGQYEEGPPAGYGYDGYDNGPAGGYGPDYGPPPPPPPPASQWKGYGPPKSDPPAARFGHRPTPYGRK